MQFTQRMKRILIFLANEPGGWSSLADVVNVLDPTGDNIGVTRVQASRALASLSKLQLIEHLGDRLGYRVLPLGKGAAR